MNALIRANAQTIEAWQDYVKTVAGGMAQAEIAKRTGVSQSNVGRWLRGEGGIPEARNVIDFARGFGRSPLETLTIAGYLLPDEVTLPETPPRTPLSEYDYAELIAELQQRDPANSRTQARARYGRLRDARPLPESGY